METIAITCLCWQAYDEWKHDVDGHGRDPSVCKRRSPLGIQCPCVEGSLARVVATHHHRTDVRSDETTLSEGVCESSRKAEATARFADSARLSQVPDELTEGAHIVPASYSDMSVYGITLVLGYAGNLLGIWEKPLNGSRS